MLVAALTGNYGMGKSSVLSMFRKLGAFTISSDAIVHELLTQPFMIRKVARLIGADVITRSGSLDKMMIAGRVFKNPDLRRRLEKILHPLVLREVRSIVRSRKGRSDIVIVEVPLLFEGNYQKQFQKIITVYAKQSVAFKRLTKRGISRKDFVCRLKAQMPISLKKKAADFVIDNSFTRQKTYQQVRKIYSAILSQAMQVRREA